MILIDGSAGEGGGQVLRSALALSILTRTPFKMERIRAGRDKPGLRPQHLTSVTAAKEVSNADVTGAEVGSRELTFRPRTVQGGNRTFSVGTAGSATLVLQTILPALLRAREPSLVTLEGGTHNSHAPPFEFLSESFLPLLRKMGAKIEATLIRPGFYPKGGGRMTVKVEPSELGALELEERVERSATLVVHLDAERGRSHHFRAVAPGLARLGGRVGLEEERATHHEVAQTSRDLSPPSLDGEEAPHTDQLRFEVTHGAEG